MDLLESLRHYGEQPDHNRAVGLAGNVRPETSAPPEGAVPTGAFPEGDAVHDSPAASAHEGVVRSRPVPSPAAVDDALTVLARGVRPEHTEAAPDGTDRATDSPARPSSDLPQYEWPHTFEFITGAAGSGKTWLTRARVANSPPGTCVLMASTGIAAVNLGDAVTINSQLGYFDTADLQQKYTHGMIQQRLRRLRASGIRRLILDEVSMLDADQLTCLVRAVLELNSEAEVLMDSSKVIGLTLVGDFLQLSPVKGKYAFTSPEWHHFTEGTERLTEIRRQGDLPFIEALHGARGGQETVDILCDYFAPRIERFQDTNFAGTTIVAKNQQVDRLNQLRHDQLPGTAESFASNRWSIARGEWKHLPVSLDLKPGALVMVLSNQYAPGERRIECANGDNGTFMGKNASGDAVVLLDRTPDHPVAVKWVTRDNKQPRKEGPRYVCSRKDCATEMPDGKTKLCPNCGASVKKDLYEIIGEITYMPLRLAYASTVHKTQGLTLDKVQIAIADPFFTAYGMLYVALSRARTPEGLRLVGTVELLRSRCRMDPEVQAWR